MSLPAGARLDFHPQPHPASVTAMLARQAALEMRLMLRNGEQLLLVAVIPVLVLVGLTLVEVVDLGPGPRVQWAVPGVVALAVLSTAFTGQAIMTGFDRRYGALKRLGATPLPRWGLVAAKSVAVLGIEVGQLVLIGGTGLALGWQPGGPDGSVHAGVVITTLLLGTAAFTSLGLLLAGTLRAEATLAAANLLWLVLFAGGDIVVPLDTLPPGVATGLSLLPSAAMTTALRAGFVSDPWPISQLLLLLAWAVAAAVAVSATFRWE